MKIKQTNQKTTYLNLFDIADSSSQEKNLTRNFAYIMAKDERALKAFLDLLKVPTIKRKWGNKLLESASVCIENHRLNGRAITDIEIEIGITNPKIFIIVECKVKDGRATEGQFKKYKPIYNCKEYDNYSKHFVFLSHRLSNVSDEDIDLKNITWHELVECFRARCNSGENSEFRGFINYYERKYAMSSIKEILTQDIKYRDEITRFENLVYRRKETNSGIPLYFAPYFTEENEDDRDAGISWIAKILGISTETNITWGQVKTKCEGWLQHYDAQTQKSILAKWEKGIVEQEQREFTYYFLDEPVRLSQSQPLKKADINNSKGWIAGMIPPNLCVTFSEFIKRGGWGA